VLTARTYPADAVVYERGSIGDHFFLLHSGRVAVEQFQWPRVAQRALINDEVHSDVKNHVLPN
jgi:hypothetical protein